MEATKWAEVTRWGKMHAWWLRHPNTDADHLSVLAALSTYANEDGYCEPSQATLAHWLKRSRPWVNRVIAQLVAVGFLEKTTRSRTNGGTTSCRYRLISQAAVVAVTPPVKACDTPRHTCDTNQSDLEQTQNGPRRAQAPTMPADDRDREADQALPADWQPADPIVKRALTLYPNADLLEHTALFVARCRGKGYKVSLDRADDLWLAWLVEDMRVRSHTTGAGKTARNEARFGRFSAWALAAATSTTAPQQL
jgi:hypothetical protein